MSQSWKINFAECFGDTKKRIVYQYFLQAPNTHRMPRSWILEVSDDDENWIKVDERIDGLPRTANIGKSFDVQQPAAGKIIRMRTTAVHSSFNAAYLGLIKWLMYGKIIEV